jgi:hypothetical protein
MTDEEFESALDWIHDEEKKISRAIQKADDAGKRRFFKVECETLSQRKKELWREHRGYVPWED